MLIFHGDAGTNGLATAWFSMADPMAARDGTNWQWHSHPARIAWVEDGLSNTIFVFEQAGRPTIYRSNTAGRSGREPVPFDGQDYYDFHVRASDGNWYNTDSFHVGGLNYRWSTFGSVVNNDNIDGVYSFHDGGAFVLLGDGGVRFVRDTVTADVMAALLTREGGEPIDAKAWQ